MANYHQSAAERASQNHADKRQTNLGRRQPESRSADVNTPSAKPTTVIPGAREAAQNRGANG